MSLRDQMARDAEALFNTDEFAEDVVFTPDHGPPVTVTVIITEGADFGRGQGGAVVAALGVMRVKRADFQNEKPKGVIERADGSVWVIGQELSSNPMTRRVEIKTRPRASFKG
jgi:hypothetical protein